MNSLTQDTTEEDDLRQSLRRSLHTIKRREPLEPTYTHFLLHHAEAKPPQLPVNLMHCQSSVLMAANLRERVEDYMKNYGVDGASSTAGRHRSFLDEKAMKAAFTMGKNNVVEEEQLMVAATAMKLSRRLPGLNIDEATRRYRIEAMTRGLQDELHKKGKMNTGHIDVKILNAVDARNRQLTLAKQKIWKMEEQTLMRERESAIDPDEIAKLDQQIAKVKEQCKVQLEKDEEVDKEQLGMMKMRLERQRQRESEQLKKMGEHRRTKGVTVDEKGKKSLKKRKLSGNQTQQLDLGMAMEESETKKNSAIYRLQQHMESPQQTLYRVYNPIFQALWAMEFDYINRSNPFRTIIDKINCASLGVPDYCQIVMKPMNLKYIQEKVGLFFISTV